MAASTRWHREIQPTEREITAQPAGFRLVRDDALRVTCSGAPTWKITVMNIRFLSLAASLALSVGGAAIAQASVGPVSPYAVASSAVGRWLYDLQGNKIGSVRRLSGDGRTVEIMVGSYFQAGSHAATVPATALFFVDGNVTLRAGTVEALNTVPRK
jgi:hypothetical protein